MKHRIVVAFIAILAACIAFPAAASAHIRAIDHGGTYWGDVSVEPNQVVDGDVDVLFGDARIEGRVNGNVNVFGGAIDATGGSLVTGQKHVVGGGFAESIAPWIPAGIAAENSRMLALLAYSAIVVLMFLIFPVRVRVALDRVEQHPALSGAVGIVAVVAVVPVAIILLFTVILWPLIPLEFIGVIVGVFIGQAALGLLVGRRLWELIRPHTTPSPLAALIVGLIVLAAAEIVPVLGHFVTALVWLIGLGATILAFFHEMGPSIGSRTTVRPPISGPPMKSV